MRKAAKKIGKTIYIGATLVEAAPQSWNTNTVKTWNSGMLSQIGNTAISISFIVITPLIIQTQMLLIF